jgi:hypothetical protein
MGWCDEVGDQVVKWSSDESGGAATVVVNVVNVTRSSCVFVRRDVKWRVSACGVVWCGVLGCFGRVGRG